LSTQSASPGPWRLTLVTNPDDCNLACDMCPCGAARALGSSAPVLGSARALDLPGPRRMDPELARAVLRERRGSALREVIPSTLGEPLLWPGLDGLLAGCAAAGLSINVTTNGTFPGRGAAAWGEAILPVSSDLKLSWNGATAATAEAVMPGLDFRRAVEAVSQLVAVRDRLACAGLRRSTVSFQVTVQEANAAELPGIVRLAARLGVDRVKLNQLQPRFPWLSDRALTRSPAALARWNAAAAAARRAAEEVHRSGAPLVLQNAGPLATDPAAPAPSGPCPFAGREAWLTWDGRFLPCPHPTADEGALGDFGSTTDRPLGELWEGEAFRRFLAGVPEGPVCRTCSFRRVGGA